MKASELRIGNYLEYYGQECFVLELLRNDYAEFGYFTDSIGFNRKLTEKHSPVPIPLTDEWLINFGFNKIGSTWVCNEIEITSWFTFRFSLNPLKVQELNYVHELQNLYFALTGSELILNNKIINH